MGSELPGDPDPESDRAGNQVPVRNAGGGIPGVGTDNSLLALILNTLVWGLVPLAEAVASLKQSEGAGKACGSGPADGAEEAPAKPPPKPILPWGTTCSGPQPGSSVDTYLLAMPLGDIAMPLGEHVQPSTRE